MRKGVDVLCSGPAERSFLTQCAGIAKFRSPVPENLFLVTSASYFVPAAIYSHKQRKYPENFTVFALSTSSSV